MGTEFLYTNADRPGLHPRAFLGPGAAGTLYEFGRTNADSTLEHRNGSASQHVPAADGQGKETVAGAFPH